MSKGGILMAKLPKFNKSSNGTTRTRNKPPKQGHKLVWLTIIIIAIPFAIIAFVLMTSLGGQNHPVTGNRFGSEDLNPSISNTQIKQVTSACQSIGGVEKVEVNLKSATLRISIDISDEMNAEGASAVANEAYNQVNAILPIETYFTNTEKGKMYDIEIDAYNYLIDENHPLSGQAYVKVYKSGAGDMIVDNMAQPKNPELSAAIKHEEAPAPVEEEPVPEEEYYGY